MQLHSIEDRIRNICAKAVGIDDAEIASLLCTLQFALYERDRLVRTHTLLALERTRLAVERRRIANETAQFLQGAKKALRKQNLVETFDPVPFPSIIRTA